MSLAPALDQSRLYLATGEDVNPMRPIFTGDVFGDVEIPGVGTMAAIVIAHPCSIRGRQGRVTPQTLVAAVDAHDKVGADQWSKGFFDRFPLPELPPSGEFHVARLGLVGLASTDDLMSADRVACLSHQGINLLQQRLVFHQTRLEVHTGKFQQAFDHTYEEAELLEEWMTELADVEDDPAASFEEWIRDGEPSRQQNLKIHEERAHIRREINAEIKARRSL